MAVKFPLKMADGAAVRTIEELREHFNLTSVLAYYRDGRLKKWLENGYYTEEANQLSVLNEDSDHIARELCTILGVNYSENEIEHIDLGDISQRNVRLEQLKRFTADDTILEAIDRVAFTQEELVSLLDDQVKEIYLCGEHFTIPGNIGGITYIGINNPAIEFSGESVAAGIDIRNLEFDIDSYVDDYVDGSREGDRFFAFFHDNLTLGMKFLRAAAEAGSAKMQTFLGDCYKLGHGIEVNQSEAFHWYQKAAEQGYARAQVIVGNAYKDGFVVPRDPSKAIRWYQKAAEQGLLSAQNNLGISYLRGVGVEQSYEKANEWFLKAAEAGHRRSQLNLGISYINGAGVEKDEEKGIEWLQKAVAQGDTKAKSILLELRPTMFKLSEVILYVVGGTDNLLVGTTLNRANSTLDVLVNNRHKVKEAVLQNYGAKYWIEPQYHSCTKTKLPTAKDILGDLVDSFKFSFLHAPLPDLQFEEETVSEDLGGGWLHIQLNEINSDTEKDFESMIKSQCRESTKEKVYDSKLLDERSELMRSRLELFLGE